MSDRKSLLEKHRNYFYGDVYSLYAGFLSRFKENDVTTPLSLQSFVCQNEIRAVIEKRTSLVPLDKISYSVRKTQGAVEDKDLTSWLMKWLEGPNFGTGRSFADFTAEILPALELDGEVALKLILRNGQPVVRRIPDESLEICTNPDNIHETTSFIARWSKTIEDGDNQREVQIREEIDDKKYLFEKDGNAVVQKHKFGFIPVVLIKREEMEGTVHGRSGVADLIEPQDNLNRCLVNIARANKYGPWGLYCTEETGVPLPEGEVTIAPGSLIATPLRKVSGDGAAECLFREKEETLDAFYRVAGLSRNKSDEMARTSDTSGKALVILNAQGKRYVANLISRLRRGFGLLCASSLVMAGKASSLQDISVTVTFPSLDTEDPSMVLDKARIMFEQGMPKEALRVLGYEDERLEKVLAERFEPYQPVSFEPTTDFDA